MSELKLIPSKNKPGSVTILGSIPYIIGKYQYWEHEEKDEFWRREVLGNGKYGEWERTEMLFDQASV